MHRYLRTCILRLSVGGRRRLVGGADIVLRQRRFKQPRSTIQLPLTRRQNAMRYVRESEALPQTNLHTHSDSYPCMLWGTLSSPPEAKKYRTLHRGCEPEEATDDWPQAFQTCDFPKDWAMYLLAAYSLGKSCASQTMTIIRRALAVA